MSALFDSAHEFLDGAETEVLNVALVPFVDSLQMTDDVREFLVQTLAREERAFRRTFTRRSEQDADRREPFTGDHQEPAEEPEEDPGAATGEERDYDAEARQRAIREEARREFEQRRRTDIRSLTEAFLDGVASRWKMEWTAELLDAEFSPNHDGSRTTWGLATAEDHQARVDLLVHNVQSNAELIARHRCAMDTLAETGAKNLHDAVVPS